MNRSDGITVETVINVIASPTATLAHELSEIGNHTFQCVPPLSLAQCLPISAPLTLYTPIKASSQLKGLAGRTLDKSKAPSHLPIHLAVWA